MIFTLRSIGLIYVIISYFSFSSLFALDYFRYKHIIQANTKTIEDTKLKIIDCKESRNNNFKDKSSIERIILIYLNTLLDKIVSDNKYLLDTYKIKASEFCITTGESEHSPFTSHGLGLITVNLNVVYKFLQQNMYMSDADIVAALSHEIAHNLLKHRLKALDKQLQIYDSSSFRSKYTSINEYDFDGDLTNTNDKLRFMRQYYPIVLNENTVSKLHEEYEKWSIFCKYNHDYIELKRQHEKEADNLGLILYLNTGFRTVNFSNQFISNQYYYNNPRLYPSIPEIFRLISQNNNYITKGEEAIKEKRFNSFMKSIEYINSKDTHPSDFWRYWNARIQTEVLQRNNNTTNNTHSTLLNSFYFRIDLSRFEDLDRLKASFSNQGNTDILVSKSKDPRLSLVRSLFNPNSSSLSYTIESFHSDPVNIGHIQKDNTMLLRANDVFQASMEYDLLQPNYCSSLFSEGDQFNNLYFSMMQKLFNTSINVP